MNELNIITKTKKLITYITEIIERVQLNIDAPMSQKWITYVWKS